MSCEPRIDLLVELIYTRFINSCTRSKGHAPVSDPFVKQSDVLQLFLQGILQCSVLLLIREFSYAAPQVSRVLPYQHRPVSAEVSLKGQVQCQSAPEKSVKTRTPTRCLRPFEMAPESLLFSDVQRSTHLYRTHS